MELFNIVKEEASDEDNAGFAFDICNVGEKGLVDVEDAQTSSSWMSISDVTKVGGITFAESHWNKQVQKSAPTKNMITLNGQNYMESTEFINRKGDKLTACCW